MNNMKKVGLTALAGALVASSAYAGALDVTGGAAITFTGQEQHDTGNGWSMGDSVTMSGSGEMDNGWNITASYEIESDQTSTGNMDSRSIKIDMGDSGTLTFAGHGGSGAMSAIDDVMPTAYEESWDVISGANVAPGGFGGNNMFNYTNSSLMDGVKITVGHLPSGGTTQLESSTDFAIEYTGVENLTIGYGQGTDQRLAAEVEDTSAYIKYVAGSFTMGFQATEGDSETASSDVEMSAYGISYAIDENTSISYGASEIQKEGSADDQEAASLGISYTMGSMKIAGSYHNVDNVNHTAAADRNGYEATLTFTF